jgi:glycosyltransferase involved in cell wall biosynthesis
MPTIDGIPQKQEWLDSYKLCDQVLTYSKWGHDVLKKDGRKGTNLVTVACPCADINVFKPVENKRDHKSKFGIDPNSLIVGTVMRNQKRKLYYDLIEAFAKWVHKTKTKGHLSLAKKTFLYLHTSYPDQGWDIGEAIKEFKVGNKVIMTYLCRNCRAAFPSFFAGDLTPCKKCGKVSAQPPNASHHVPREVLAKIMNIFDLYVQYSICEGWGMPLTEAQSCGIPTMAVRYSAMEDHLLAPHSIPIEVQRFFRESMSETEQRRALPDNQDFCNKLDNFLKLSQEKRDKMGKDIRQYIIEPVETYGTDVKYPRFGWDRTAEIWRNVINNTDIYDEQKTWLNPEPRILTLEIDPSLHKMNNSEFVRWVIINVWGKPEFAHTHFAGHWIKGLNCGYMHDGPRTIKTDRNIIIDHFAKLARTANEIERARVFRNQNAEDDKIKLVTL